MQIVCVCNTYNLYWTVLHKVKDNYLYNKNLLKFLFGDV